MARVRFPAPYLFLLPLLYVPDLGFSRETPLGIIGPSDIVLVPLVLALLLGTSVRSGIPQAVRRLFLLFVATAILSTLLFWLLRPGAFGYSKLLFSLNKIGKFSAYAILGLLVARRIRSVRDAELIFKSLAVGSVILALGIIMTAITKWEPGTLLIKKDLFPYKASNQISVVLASFGVFYAILPRGADTRLRPRLILLAVLYASMLLTGGRGGWFGALIGCAYVIYATTRNRNGYVASAILVVVATVMIVRLPAVRTRAEDVVVVVDPVSGEERWGLDDGARFDTWRHEGAKVLHAPLFGVGFFNRGQASGLWSSGSHNFYIQVALETGLVGLLVFFAMLLRIWRSVPLRAGPEVPGWLLQHDLAFRAGLVTACAASMTGEYFYGGLVLGTLSMLYGTTVACRRVVAGSGGSGAAADPVTAGIHALGGAGR